MRFLASETCRSCAAKHVFKLSVMVASSIFLYSLATESARFCSDGVLRVEKVRARRVISSDCDVCSQSSKKGEG